jgi:hypothetical protein
MALKLGTATPSKLYIGSTEVTKAYLGASEVYSTGTALDPDAAAYITAVETADGQALEAGVVTAINDFVVGCKADGIWTAIKASCILAGARTLSGALVPLVGTAPTNLNFVSGDYNRKTGLVGDGSTKYLNSNRNNNADPQNSRHLAAYVSILPSQVSHIISARGQNTGEIGGSRMELDASGNPNYQLAISTDSTSAIGTSGIGLYGVTRNSSSTITARSNKALNSASQTSTTPSSCIYGVQARIQPNGSVNAYSNARIAFYSIGEAVDLALLDTRVSALMTAIDGAIP